MTTLNTDKTSDLCPRHANNKTFPRRVYPIRKIKFNNPLIRTERDVMERAMAQDEETTIEQIYEAGFRVTGARNCFRCGSCQLGIKNVPAYADLVTEHFRFSSSCEYLFEKYGQDLHFYQQTVLKNFLFNEKIVDPTLFKTDEYIDLKYAISPDARASFNDLFDLTNTDKKTFSQQGFYATGVNGDVSCSVCDAHLKLKPLLEFRSNKNKHQSKCPFKT